MTAPWPWHSRDTDWHASSAKGAARLRRVNRWLAEDLRERLADLYEESRATAPSKAYRGRGRQDFLNRLTDEIRQPGFAMVIAETNSLMGCAFGFPVRSDGFWWQGFEGALPRSIGQLTDADRLFAISNILIRPHEHGEDLAHRLQERLLADHQASLGTTLVDQADRPALAAFRSWGWQDIGDIWRRSGPTMFRVLVLPVGERTAARLNGPDRHTWTR
jgi:hypothetical protein